ncbi:MAG: hypothetical protein GX596_13960, partial [Propionibacterium sp.]|nr:hypothetical protein [Propionibacterium sp.]
MATVVLVAGGGFLAPPAHADAQGFALNGHTFGPNQYVTIDIGTLTRDCDVFWTTSDLYVVPTGTVSEGSALTDVSGAPNTVMGTGLGSGIFGEVIAITAPGGTLGPGTYDIVEDTCQDGIFNGTDSILSNAFEVVIPTDIPVLPDPQIQAMKSGATAQAEHWASAALAYEAFFAATTAYSLISDATNFQGFYLTYVCAFLPEIEGSPVSPWCPTVSASDVMRLQAAVVKTIVDRSSHYRGIAADPPDPNFQDPSVPGPREGIEAPGGSPMWTAVANWANQVDHVNALSGAFLGSLEKYQGAAIADDAPAALMHARDIQSYARLLNTMLSQETSALSSLSSAGGINANTALTRLRGGLQRLESDGFSASDERALRNLGATPEQLDDLRGFILEHIDPGTGTFNSLYQSHVSINQQMGAAYTGLANAMTPIITELQNVVAGEGATA